MLEWICHLKPMHPSWEGPQHVPFTVTMRIKFVRPPPNILEELYDHSYLFFNKISNLFLSFRF